jgi:hypothetical protein
MDTLKDRQNLELLAESGAPPWAVWEKPAETDGAGAPPAEPDPLAAF